MGQDHSSETETINNISRAASGINQLTTSKCVIWLAVLKKVSIMLDKQATLSVDEKMALDASIRNIEEFITKSYVDSYEPKEYSAYSDIYMEQIRAIIDELKLDVNEKKASDNVVPNDCIIELPEIPVNIGAATRPTRAGRSQLPA